MSQPERYYDSEKPVLPQNQSYRRRRFALYRWPAIFLGVLFGLIALSEVIPNRRLHDFTSHYINHSNSSQNSNETWVSDDVAVAVEYLLPENITSPHPVLDTVLHPERRSLSSPNKQWQLRLADNADLVLERNQSNTWLPVWWANSATYKQRVETPSQRYLTLSRNGSVHITTRTTDERGNVQVLQHWDSSKQRQCSIRIDNDGLLRGLAEPPVRQSLTLDDNGRLIIWDVDGKAMCILSDSQDTVLSTSLDGNVDLTVVEEEAVPTNHTWPMYRDSTKLSLLQLRAMLERDLAMKNRTLNLSPAQLETIHNTAIVIPSFRGHLDYCVKFLRSMIRNCVDCDRWQINIIVVEEDMALFQRDMLKGGKDSIAYWLPGLRIVEYEKMQFDHYAPEIDVAAETKKQHKLILQDFKKNHGCLVTGKRHCSLLDSEGIIIRTTWYADIVKEYLDAPYVIHNPDNRNGSTKFIGWSTPVGEIMNIPNWSDVGWLLEYYSWIFDAGIYNQVARIVAEKYPLAKDSPQEFFTEICYYGYIWGKKGAVPGPQYRFIESKELLGERLYNMTWNRFVYEDPSNADLAKDRVNERGIIEDMRVWLHRFPNTLVPAAQRWNQFNLRYYKSDEDWWASMAFLSVAKSVQVCVSEQPLELYEAAMSGALNLE